MSIDNNKKEMFKQRVLQWAQKLNVSASSIVVRPMKTKWASCSTSGRLTFDVLLPNMSDELQDYVIVHELLHSRIPNHGKLWKSLMRAHLGDYEKLEMRLKQCLPGYSSGELRTGFSKNRLSV